MPSKGEVTTGLSQMVLEGLPGGLPQTTIAILLHRIALQA
jgi:hypothetical protein